jgi:hypothetical protein
VRDDTDMVDERIVLEHLEAHLGQMSVGWERNADGIRLPFRVLRFNAAPDPGAVTFSTLGLSTEELRSPRDGRVIRQEFLMTCLADQADYNIPAILQQVALERIRTKEAILRGEVLGPRGSLFPIGGMSALYAAIPVYFPQDIQTVTVAIGQQAVFVWLMPIHATEAAYVETHGWRAFEELLEREDPDLRDLARAAIV